MTIQEEREKLIAWLSEVEDENIIQQVIEIQNSANQRTMSIAERQALQKGLDSIEQGKVYTHAQVMEAMKLKYPEIFS